MYPQRIGKYGMPPLPWLVGGDALTDRDKVRDRPFGPANLLTPFGRGPKVTRAALSRRAATPSNVEGCLFDNDGSYSISPESAARSMRSSFVGVNDSKKLARDPARE